jgi:threonine aldolase
VALPQTNILLVPVPNANAAIAILEEAAVRVLAVGSSLRFVTHRDLSEADVTLALERIRPITDRLVTTWEGERPMV